MKDQFWTTDLLFKNNRICKHVTSFKTFPSQPLSCGRHKCMALYCLNNLDTDDNYIVYHDRNSHLKSSASLHYDEKQLITVVRNSHLNMFRFTASRKILKKQKIGLCWKLLLTNKVNFWSLWRNCNKFFLKKGTPRCRFPFSKVYGYFWSTRKYSTLFLKLIK